MTLKKLIIVANTIEKKLNKFADVANTDTLANIVNAVSSKFSDTLKVYMSAHMKKHNISELQCRFFLNMKFSNKKCIDCKVVVAPSGPLSNDKNFIESYSTLVSPLEPNIKATVDNVNLKERLPVENDYPVVKLFDHTFYATRSTTASNNVSKLQSVADDIERRLSKFAKPEAKDEPINVGYENIEPYLQSKYAQPALNQIVPTMLAFGKSFDKSALEAKYKDHSINCFFMAEITLTLNIDESRKCVSALLYPKAVITVEATKDSETKKEVIEPKELSNKMASALNTKFSKIICADVTNVIKKYPNLTGEYAFKLITSDNVPM